MKSRTPPSLIFLNPKIWMMKTVHRDFLITRLSLPGHWSRSQMVVSLIKVIKIGIPILIWKKVIFLKVDVGVLHSQD